MATKFAEMAHEGRIDPRHDVHHRLPARDHQGRVHRIVVVNISAQGVMARSDHAFAIGERLYLDLPIAGRFEAEIRWVLGGRIGCRLDRAIPPPRFYPMLAAMADTI